MSWPKGQLVFVYGGKKKKRATFSSHKTLLSNKTHF